MKKKKKVKRLQFPKIEDYDPNLEDIHRWGGDIYSKTFSFNFLKKNYGNIALIFPKLLRIHKKTANKFYIITEQKDDMKYFLEKQTDKKIAIIEFVWKCQDEGHHAGLLVYNFKHKTLERFEPHGTSGCYNERNNIDDLFEKEFSKYVKVKKHYPPMDLCPQIMESKTRRKAYELGNCSAWALWYSELRLLNPDVTQEKIVKYGLDYLKRIDPLVFHSEIFSNGFRKEQNNQRKKY